MNDKKRKSKKKIRRYSRVRVKKATTNMPTVAIPKKWNGFPNMIRTRLRYCDDYIVASGASTNGIKLQLNSLFRPDPTVSPPHQPMWRDNYNQIYSTYLVTNVVVTTQIVTLDPNSIIVTQRCTNESTSIPTNLSLECERTGGRIFFVTPNGGKYYSKKKYNMAKILGITANEYASDTAYRIPMGNDPLEIVYFYLAMQNVDQSTNTRTYVLLTLDFDVCFYDLIQNQPQN